MNSLSLVRWWNLFRQILEYLVFAAREFKNTPEGAKEWQDILDAYEEAVQMDLNDDGNIGRTPNTAPQARSAKAQPRAPETTPASNETPSDDELSTTTRRVFE